MMSILTPILNFINPQRVARKSRSQILQQYGPPGPEYLQKYCITVDFSKQFPWFPHKGGILINRDFSAQLIRAFTSLQTTQAVLQASGQDSRLCDEIKTFDGCYNDRLTRGSSTLISLHAWAMAMDLNASRNQLGQLVPGWSVEFLNVMRAYVYCGADFISRKDPMHFSLYGE